MKKTFSTCAVLAGALMLSACGETAADSAEGGEAATAEDATEVAAAEECTQETMVAKAQEVGEKMQGMASDPEAMQEIAGKLQEVQQKVQDGAADGSFGPAEACAVYDEILAAAE